jgi:hypothetical protein
MVMAAAARQPSPIVTAALAAKSCAETPNRACREVRSEACVVRSPVRGCADDTHDVAQRLLYSSWWRHQ